MWISTFNNSGQGYVSGNSVKHLYRWSQPPLYICCGLQDLLDTAQLDAGFSRASQHVRERQTATGGWKNPHRRIHAPWSGGGRLLRLEGEMDPGWPTSWHFVAEIQASRFLGRRWGVVHGGPSAVFRGNWRILSCCISWIYGLTSQVLKCESSESWVGVTHRDTLNEIAFFEGCHLFSTGEIFEDTAFFEVWSSKAATVPWLEDLQ